MFLIYFLFFYSFTFYSGTTKEAARGLCHSPPTLATSAAAIKEGRKRDKKVLLPEEDENLGVHDGKDDEGHDVLHQEDHHGEAVLDKIVRELLGADLEKRSTSNSSKTLKKEHAERLLKSKAVRGL